MNSEWEQIAYWLKKLQEGNEKAFLKVVHIMQQTMARFVHKHIYQYGLIEEATSDGFLRVYNNRKSAPVDNIKHLKNWCYLIFKHAAYDIKKPSVSEPLGSDGECGELKRWEDDKALLRIFKIISDELNKMPGKYSEPFKYFYELNYDYNEISGILKKPEGTIKSRMRKAKILIRRRFGKEGWL